MLHFSGFHKFVLYVNLETKQKKYYEEDKWTKENVWERGREYILRAINEWMDEYESMGGE